MAALGVAALSLAQWFYLPVNQRINQWRAQLEPKKRRVVNFACWFGLIAFIPLLVWQPVAVGTIVILTGLLLMINRLIPK